MAARGLIKLPLKTCNTGFLSSYRHGTLCVMKIQIIAPGHLKKGPFFTLFEDYKKRLHLSLSITEIQVRARDEKSAMREEHENIFKHIDDRAYVIALDERGKTINSPDFAKQIEHCQINNVPLIQCIIGGANGLSDDIRNRADLILSFGKQTWPHMMVRVMLIEQLYRTQQILAGHPYHKS